MKCFPFTNWDKKDEPPTTPKSLFSIRSSCATFNDNEVGRIGSELTSQNVSAISVESEARPSYPSMSQRPSNLKEFTIAELKSATKNFSRSVVIGEGGFGCVYKGLIKNSEDPSQKVEVAVKQLGRRGVQGHKEWMTEVNFLGIVEHQNLVKLVGYCADDDERGIQRLLVYEYMPNGSVDQYLSPKSETILTWAMRLKIAQDAARGLAYLHEGMDFQVVGTMGYAAPEYVQTGRLAARSDVWSYGVFLYELITGRRPIDRNRPRSEQKLLAWVKPYLSDAKQFRQIVDPRLEGKYSLRLVSKLSHVANLCLVKNARTRPKMSEVLEMVNKIVDASAEAGSPRRPLRSSTSRETPDHTKTKHKRRIIESKTRESGTLFWKWRQKLIRTC
ncbi:serine/threonine-protein kinase PCRK1 [Citrus sinensis]|uniref:Serine/threonine-protein kinase PCRK1 n=1 Tax=Citrus sinensis TaxID=2711 RepID=A0ACB8JRE0_CITSI|nr:serine/threonine-protein kinase PCRK1 [Citrus sinensis]